MNNKNESLNPTIDPSKGVKRLNKLPLIIFCSIGALVMVTIIGGIFSKTQKKEVAEEVTEEAIMDDESVALLASEIPEGDIAANSPEIVNVIIDTPEKKEANDKVLLKETTAGIDPALLKRIQELEEAHRKQNEELRKIREQEMKEVVDAPASVIIDDFRSQYKSLGNGGKKEIKKATYYDPVEPDFGGSPGVLPPLADNDVLGIEKLTAAEIQKTKLAQNAYNKRAEDDEFILPYRVQEPVTELEIKTGSIINATMITGINSDLGGNIIAQVNQNVFDTATGDHLLIPQGTKLFGNYNDNNTYGVDRVGIIWKRIIFPNGESLSVGDLAGSDVEGYSGLEDKVNHHYLRIFGSAILLSGASVGVAITDDDSDEDSASQTAREEVAVNIGRVISQKMEKDINIEPTIEIRQGMKLAVLVARDMTFDKPYKQHINYSKLGHPTPPKKKVFDPREGEAFSSAKEVLPDAFIHSGK